MRKDHWTPAKIEYAVKLSGFGKTMTEIAAALGPEFTKGMVVGKLHRLKGSRFIGDRIRIKRIASTALKTSEGVVYTIGSNVSIAQLFDHSCRWPMWRHEAQPFSEKLYCGAYALGRAENAPYCKAHTKKSIRPW